jgi:hypothetical protein
MTGKQTESKQAAAAKVFRTMLTAKTPANTTADEKQGSSSCDSGPDDDDGNCSKWRRKDETNKYDREADGKQENWVTATSCLSKFCVQLLVQTSGHFILHKGR